MKNLIVTLGILLLFLTGIQYEQDMTQVMLAQRRLQWVCREMAQGAAQAAAAGEEQARNAAGEILLRNIKTETGSGPSQAVGGSLAIQWEMEIDADGAHVTAVWPSFPVKLVFLRDEVALRAAAAAPFPENFGESTESS